VDTAGAAVGLDEPDEGEEDEVMEDSGEEL
jgi:hypothetical protein